MKIENVFLVAVLIVCMTACTEKQSEKESEKKTTIMKNEECLICGAPLEYLEQDTLMEGVLCHNSPGSDPW